MKGEKYEKIVIFISINYDSVFYSDYADKCKGKSSN